MVKVAENDRRVRENHESGQRQA